MNVLRQLFLEHLAQTSESPLMLEINKADGVFLFGPDGKKYFDLISGISVSNLGHGNPMVVKAVQSQAADFMHLMVYGEYIQKPQVELTAQLTRLLPENLNSVYLVNSGSEAVEGALKLAKRFTGRSEIVAFKNAYHGSTHGALSVMGCEEQKRNYRPLLPDVRLLNFNSIADLDHITTRTACVIIEPIQGEGGIRLPNVDYLRKLKQRCSETGALLIFDEIQTGMGRTGSMFAFQRFEVIPDILLLAKAFGGGMPLGAFISSKEIMRVLTHNPILGHITTFGGHPVSCAAAIASLNFLMHEKVVEQVEHKGSILAEALAKHPKVREVRRAGLMMAVELGTFDRVQALIKYGLDHGFILDWFLFCNTAVRIAPPLIITEDECRIVANLIVEGLNAIQ
ncbi:aspartate aminotransferase family protein [Tenuifilum sp.]|uniref:aspartate aminotransferase family protein n=1 Tax=Tenuifilum sp. TaxID=2760880 RepID=UPI001B6BA896|nr:aspartate aminotransferase family protein [Bacteroidales bacterium]HOK60180.1 aspartate aminotransferase family protein [Tenuifilum sp.]MBP9029521.1 aspartate aminotransferase family protein [Bacteroidales bacterium]HOK86639.1 aspartate aminotransferase family protein [Tenuifilum sp.]HON71519.1 aspartate aminotransferase family protein [Tenuifilum sp.]